MAFPLFEVEKGGGAGLLTDMCYVPLWGSVGDEHQFVLVLGLLLSKGYDMLSLLYFLVQNTHPFVSSQTTFLPRNFKYLKFSLKSWASVCW